MKALCLTCCLALLALPVLAVADEPLVAEIPQTPLEPRPALAFGTDGSGPWRLSPEDAVLVDDGKAAGGRALELTGRGSATMSLTVDRGTTLMGSQRYLVSVRARSAEGTARPGLTLATGAGSRTSYGPRSNAWDTLQCTIETRERVPGRDSDTLTMTLFARGDGTVFFSDPSISRIPHYGVYLRYRVSEPSDARFRDTIRIIRRHRDTGHPDGARHYYHSTIAGQGGDAGVPSGRFSDWIDLRRYLFGNGWVTTGLELLPVDADGQAGERRPVTATIELAFDVGTPETGPAETEPMVPEALLTEDDDFGIDLEDLQEKPAPPPPGIFLRRELTSSSGVFGFKLPENGVPPDRFPGAAETLREEIESRYRWAQDTLPPLPPRPSVGRPYRIPIGANVFPMDNYIAPESIQREMDLVLRIGIRAAHAGGSGAQLFDAAHRRQYGCDPLYRLVYWKISGAGETSFSPYDGDKHEAAMQAWFDRLAEQLDATPDSQTDVTTVVYLWDEPGNQGVGAADLGAFRDFLKAQELDPSFFGAAAWEDIVPFGYQPAEEIEVPELPEADLSMEDDALLPAGVDPLASDEPEENVPSEDTEEARPSLEQRRLKYMTRLFSAKKTSDFFRIATEAAQARIPNVRTVVNFRSGVRRVLTPETADWFQMGRDRAVSMMWNEDWLNTYGWRRHGIELVSYYVELMRTAARKHDLPVGGFLMCYWGQAELKSYSALAHGSRYLNYWRYGPAYANYLPYSWSHSRDTVQQIATVSRDVARIEHVLADAEREPASTALLYAKADPVWGRSQAENRLVFFALLHDQVPVDIVTEVQIEEDGILDTYGTLYVTDVSVRRRTQEVLADWVRAGGRIWLSGDAATRDEYDEPCRILSDALNTKAGIVLFPDGTPAQRRGQAGEGCYCICAFRPGQQYEDTVRPHFNRSHGKGEIQSGWLTERRRWITKFALESENVRPVVLDRPCIEAVLYRHPDTDVAMLINYTGEYPDTPMSVRVRSGKEVQRVESLRHGNVPFTQTGETVSFSLPIHRTDSVLLHYHE